MFSALRARSRAARRKHPRRSRGVRLAAQRADVGHEIGGRLFVVEYPRDPGHLRAVEILRVPAANTGPEVVQLSDEVPVALVGKPRRLGGPHARPSVPWQLAQVTYVRAPRSASPCSVARGGSSGSVAMCAATFATAVSSSIEANGTICAAMVSPRAATDAVLEIAELLGDVPWVLSGQLRCVQRPCCPRRLPHGTRCRSQTSPGPQPHPAPVAPRSAKVGCCASQVR